MARKTNGNPPRDDMTREASNDPPPFFIPMKVPDELPEGGFLRWSVRDIDEVFCPDWVRSVEQLLAMLDDIREDLLSLAESAAKANRPDIGQDIANGLRACDDMRNACIWRLNLDRGEYES